MKNKKAYTKPEFYMEEFAEVTLVHTEELLHMHHTQEFRDMSFRERLLRLMKMTED